MAHPTLVIGIGGTGTHVVAELENILGELRGRGIALLVIDARRQPERDLRHAVFLGMSDAVHFPSAYAFSRAQVEPWWPQGLAPSPMVSFVDGCGMIRAFGRFFALYHWPHLVESVRRGLEELERNTDPTWPHDTLDCFIVGSLTNGTGAGLLHDVAALVRQMARDKLGMAHVRIAGVHLDAAAIAGPVAAPAADTEQRRRIANSVAALVELQACYELRARPDWRWTARVRNAAGEWQDFGLTPAETPFDHTFVVQGIDRDGSMIRRETAIGVVAETLALWLTGADRADRTLDLIVPLADGPRRFGSVGAARFRVPDDALADIVELRLLRDVIDWMSSGEPAGAAEVLRAADENLTLPDPDVREAVRHLFQETLRVQEAPGSEINQLFDRLRDDDEQRERRLRQLHHQIDAEPDRAMLPGLVQSVRDYLGGLEGLHEERKAWARELWHKDIEPVLDRWIHAIVGAGALELARQAVEELEELTRRNREDVAENEAKEANEANRPSLADLDHSVQAVGAEVGQLWGTILERLGLGRRLSTAIEDIKALSLKNLRWYLRASAVEAVFTVYDSMLRWAEARERALEFMAGHLVREGMKSAIEAELKDARDRLNGYGSVLGRPRLVPVGTSNAFIQDLVRRFRKRTREPRELAAEHGRGLIEHFDELVHAAGDPRKWSALAETHRWRRHEERLRSDVRRGISQLVRDRVLHELTFDQVLRREVELDLAEWERHFLEETDSRRQEAMKKALAQRYDDTVADALHKLPWRRSYSKARDEAVEMLAAARLKRIYRVASPPWKPAPHASHSRLVVALVHPDNTWARSLLAGWAGRGKGTQVEFHVQTEHALPRTEVAMVRLDVGLHLDDLRLSEDDINVYHQLVRSTVYPPHVDRRFGKEWPLPERWEPDGRERWAARIELARELGIVRFDSGRALVWARNLTVRRPDGPPRPHAAHTRIVDDPNARAELGTVRAIVSRSGLDGPTDLRIVLRDELARRLGAQGQTTLLQTLQALLFQLDQRFNGATDPDLKTYLQHAIRGIGEVLQRIEDTNAVVEWL